MNSMTEKFLTYADRFSAVVAAGDDWRGTSPCPGWTAADVLRHVVDTQRDFLTKQGADLAPLPDGDPPEVWRSHLDDVRRLVADDAFVEQEYDGYFGPTTIADTLATFYGFDLVVHRWDLARALGGDTEFSTDEMDAIEAAIPGFGDALYFEGVCGPPVDVPDDAPRQQRLLGVLGRHS